MSNDRIIIASCGHNTQIMVNGKLYGDGVAKVEFSHDCTGEKKKGAQLHLTVDRLPVREGSVMEKQGFKKLLEDFLKEELISVEAVNETETSKDVKAIQELKDIVSENLQDVKPLAPEIFSRKGDPGEVHIKLGETEITRTKEGIFISAPKIDLGSVSEIKD